MSSEESDLESVAEKASQDRQLLQGLRADRKSVQTNIQEGDITALLKTWRNGETGGLETLIPRVIDELRQIARRHLSKERPGFSLQATELVNELYLRLTGAQRVEYNNREHFFNFASTLMRRILVEQARSRNSQKNPKSQRETTLEGLQLAVPSGLEPETLLSLDQALTLLETSRPRQAQIVTFHYFAGLTAEEIGETLDLSRSTVKRDIRGAKLWLAAALIKKGDTAPSRRQGKP